MSTPAMAAAQNGSMTLESSTPVEPAPSSGIRVVIVGAGFGGLAAAIECTRKGYTCIVLEAFKNLDSQLGDIIGLHSNAGTIFRRWPGVHEKLDPICDTSSHLVYRTWDGEEVLRQFWGDEDGIYGKKYTGHRAEIHKILFDHAISQGVEIRLSQKVTEYFETDTEAGVVSNGERIVGDVVLAADGVRSEARSLALGYHDKPKSSGYAIYRAWMSSEELAKNELTRELVSHGDQHIGWMARACTSSRRRSRTPRSFAGTARIPTRAMSTKDGPFWPTTKTHELVIRDPVPTWVSSKGRMALIGDVAHPFLPTSAQGGSQAVEDGACVAVCLQLSGKEHVGDALRAYEKIRFERVTAIQKIGMDALEKFSNVDHNMAKENPEGVKFKREAWILGHDAEAHAYKMYPEVVASLYS